MSYNLVPRTWRLCDNEDLNWYYEDICQKAISEGLIKYMPRLYLFKSTRTWGWCRYLHDDVVIGLNEVYCQDPQKAINTIIHEIGHAATTGHHHDDVWKRASNRLGVLYGEIIKRTSSESERELSLGRKQTVRYIVECPNCHTQWKYQRMTKCVTRPETFKCPYCKSKLVRVK